MFYKDSVQKNVSLSLSLFFLMSPGATFAKGHGTSSEDRKILAQRLRNDAHHQENLLKKYKGLQVFDASILARPSLSSTQLVVIVTLMTLGVITPLASAGHKGSLRSYEEVIVRHGICPSRVYDSYFNNQVSSKRLDDATLNHLRQRIIEGTCLHKHGGTDLLHVDDFLRCVAESKAICDEELAKPFQMPTCRDVTLKSLTLVQDDMSADAGGAAEREHRIERLCPQLSGDCYLKNHALESFCREKPSPLLCLTEAKQICGKKNGDPVLADPHWSACGTSR